jgi:hypothetical protein
VALAVWPDTLPQIFRSDSFQDTMEDGLIKDGMNVGPPAYRRRSSAAPQPFAGTMPMTTAEWEILQSFFGATLYDGALRFSLPPQGTTDIITLWTARFTKPPRRQSLNSDDLWLVTLEMERVGAGQISTGSNLFRDPDIFYGPTIFGRQLIVPPLFAPASTFYAVVISGPHTISPPLYTDADTFRVPSLRYRQFLTASLYTDADAFYIAAVLHTPAADLFADPDTFFTTIVSGPQFKFPSFVTDPETFFAARVTMRITPTARVTDADTFFAPSVAHSGFGSGRLNDPETFFPPTVA